MVRVYYLGLSERNPREENQGEPPTFVTVEELHALTGVESYKVNQERYLECTVLNELKEKRGYSYEDEVILTKEQLPNYEEQLRNFFTEHLHEYEEIRLVLEGSGYFDVRDANDEWIRITATAGDMIIMPSGIYHRFTLDTKNYMRAKRYFSGSPEWTAYYRPADHMECRKVYLEKISTGRWKAVP